MNDRPAYQIPKEIRDMERFFDGQEEDCYYCKGTGKKRFGYTCFICEGAGKLLHGEPIKTFTVKGA